MMFKWILSFWCYVECYVWYFFSLSSTCPLHLLHSHMPFSLYLKMVSWSFVYCQWSIHFSNELKLWMWCANTLNQSTLSTIMNYEYRRCLKKATDCMRKWNIDWYSSNVGRSAYNNNNNNKNLLLMCCLFLILILLKWKKNEERFFFFHQIKYVLNDDMHLF